MTTIIWKAHGATGTSRSRYKARRKAKHSAAASEQRLQQAIERCLTPGNPRVTRAIQVTACYRKRG